ncbi:MAG TPA: AbrB/MazE/SpoVT family DNA-binding domain-containing protein [Gammaproteobacteria bacterium]|nr:AbrB/MazE/SpoVT family DNA-binding domain-containing protein [Gammaproteobacteria bacterium]
MYSSRLTGKGQVTLPAKMRKQLSLHQGDAVEFRLEGDRIIMMRKEKNIEAAFGLYKADKSVSLEDMDKAIRRRAQR